MAYTHLLKIKTCDIDIEADVEFTQREMHIKVISGLTDMPVSRRTALLSLYEALERFALTCDEVDEIELSQK